MASDGDHLMKPGTCNLEREPLRVVAADDSAVMRRILRHVFELHAADGTSALPRMTLVGLVTNGVEALAAVERLRPDVLLLDLEMPQMGGLSALDRLRTTAPTLPVIMCSAHTARGAQITLDALRRGANDYVMKPCEQADLSAALDLLTRELLPRIAALAGASAEAQAVAHSVMPAPVPQSLPAVLALPAALESQQLVTRLDGGAPIEVIVIGVSTGGPAALEHLLPILPANLPVPVMIVQHMPKVFTSVLAERLDKLCRLRVMEAREGTRVLAGTILLAPGDAHLEAAAAPYALPGVAHVRLHQGPALNSCKPSVDYLFQSAARLYGAGTLALVLTGMGSDGVNGARAVVTAGGTVLAQDEASSAVWGMPGRVSREGLATATLPLRSLGAVIVQRVMQSRPPVRTAALEATNRREASYGLF